MIDGSINQAATPWLVVHQPTKSTEASMDIDSEPSVTKLHAVMTVEALPQ